MAVVTSWTVHSVTVPIVIFIILLLMRPSDQFTVIGPAEPILVKLGEDVLLPCHLSPKMSAKNMEVRWFQSHFSDAIYVYRDEKAQDEEQAVEYRGRTELMKDTIAEGNVALRIQRVRTSDNGQYWCRFQENHEYGEVQLKVIVTSLGTDPSIRMEGPVDKRIRLVCNSRGWFPEPQAKWKNTGGEEPLFSKIQILFIDGLFDVEMSLEVREDSSVRNVSCSIYNPVLGEEKVSFISISEKLDEELVTSTRKAADGLWVYVVLFICFMIYTEITCQKREREDTGNQQVCQRECCQRETSAWEQNQMIREPLDKEKEPLANERESLVKERESLAKERQSLAKERESLNADRESLAKERQSLAKEREFLDTKRESLNKENYASGREEQKDSVDWGESKYLAKERESLAKEVDSLHKERESLATEREFLVKERESLNADRESLAKERQSLAKEREFLDTKRESLNKENYASGREEQKDSVDWGESKYLAKERESLAKEVDSLHKERESLATEREFLAKERESLNADRESLAKERQSLAKEREFLDTKRESLNKENYASGQEEQKDSVDWGENKYLAKERESLAKEVDSLHKERESLATEREFLVKERESLNADRESLAKERQSLAKEREFLDTKRESLNKENYASGREEQKDSVDWGESKYLAKERESLAKEVDSLHKERESLATEREFLAKERESLNADRESLAKERQSLAKERESLNTEKWSSKKETKSLDKERQFFTSKKEVVGKENKLQVELQEEIERRKDLYHADWRKAHLYADWRKEQFQAVHVTLDPDTAHPDLILSEEWRCVIRGESPQSFPDTTNRFDSLPCVLGQEKITSGRHYWEVEVGNRADWDLGVCRDDVKKKGVVTVSPENGFWALRLYDDEYWALTSPPTSLSLRQSPHKLAIFVDYDAGDVSFYNMNDGSHIYNFTSISFYGALCPFIRLWSYDQAPVTICPEP
ncbi:butyrophilin subfamily 2 member A1-like [Dromiciops gliroides]|uniref:butyrophilin subfamily 2 member A1-like n=1 Tax=Dromiciops gliroides TaxID=33562 RepID=UPI001CC5A40E|nr:butyrophilin subfamily 2 member A1-like [Dromiciops gliroides]